MTTRIIIVASCGAILGGSLACSSYSATIVKASEDAGVTGGQSSYGGSTNTMVSATGGSGNAGGTLALSSTTGGSATVSTGTAGAGGEVATGGSMATSASTGGASHASGGVIASGGMPGSGGVVIPVGGGVATGGAISSGGASIGGSAATGGVAGGGNAATGGVAAGGGVATGGAVASGGAAIGGNAATGGVAAGGNAAGGVAAGGGVATTGGAVASGGAVATGGACATLLCNTPPAASCPNPNTARTYAATGTCDSGVCNYAHTDAPCQSGATCTSGLCSCNNGLNECGTACVDLTRDKENCGACGHSCLGGDCSGAKCQPVQVTAVTGYLNDLEIDTDYVYWSEDNPSTIRRIGKQGGDSELLVTNQANVNALVPAGTRLFWGVDSGLRAKSLTETGYSDLATVEGGIGDMKLSGSWIYYVDSSIRRISVNGGASEKLTDSVGGANELTVIGDCVYHHQRYSDQVGYYCPSPGSTGTFYTATSNIKDGIDSDMTAVYVGYNQGLLKISLDQSQTVLVPGVYVGWISVDATDAYYVQGSIGSYGCGSNFSIWKVAKNGGSPQVLVDQPVACPVYLRSDAKALYWFNRDSSQIMKLAK